MNSALKAQIIRYWLAMNYSAAKSGLHAARAFFGVAGAHALNDSVSALTLQQLGCAFLLAFGCEILNYLDAHPISFLQLPSEPLATPASTTTINPTIK